MNIIPVSYKGENEDLVNNYNNDPNKSHSSWLDQKYEFLKKWIKDHYLKEQNFTCVFCRQKMVTKHKRVWDIEHIIPKSKYPQFLFEPRNLCVCCPDCNISKNDQKVLDREGRKKFPTSSRAYRIVHPHFDNYEEHIQALDVGKLYLPKTTKGRTTIRIYGLDRFMVDAGRSQISNRYPEVQKLHATALCTDDEKEYEKVENELLIRLALKYSDKIGPENVINIQKAFI